MGKSLRTKETQIHYAGRVFKAVNNRETGEVNSETMFTYHQVNTLVWATYCGGEIQKGFLIGSVAENGDLDFYYEHRNTQHKIRVGKCHSTPCIRSDGILELQESWQWLDEGCSKGTSTLEEVSIEKS